MARVEEGAGGGRGAGGGAWLDITHALLGCNRASIENNDMCIGMHWCLYWSVFELFLGWLMNVLATVLAHFGKMACHVFGLYFYCLCMSYFQYIPALQITMHKEIQANTGP